MYCEFAVLRTSIASDMALTNVYNGIAFGVSTCGDDVVLGIKAWTKKTTRVKSPYEYERTSQVW